MSDIKKGFKIGLGIALSLLLISIIGIFIIGGFSLVGIKEINKQYNINKTNSDIKLNAFLDSANRSLSYSWEINHYTNNDIPEVSLEIFFANKSNKQINGIDYDFKIYDQFNDEIYSGNDKSNISIKPLKEEKVAKFIMNEYSAIFTNFNDIYSCAKSKNCRVELMPTRILFEDGSEIAI